MGARRGFSDVPGTISPSHMETRILGPLLNLRQLAELFVPAQGIQLVLKRGRLEHTGWHNVCRFDVRGCVGVQGQESAGPED